MRTKSPVCGANHPRSHPQHGEQTQSSPRKEEQTLSTSYEIKSELVVFFKRLALPASPPAA